MHSLPKREIIFAEIKFCEFRKIWSISRKLVSVKTKGKRSNHLVCLILLTTFLILYEKITATDRMTKSAKFNASKIFEVRFFAKINSCKKKAKQNKKTRHTYSDNLRLIFQRFNTCTIIMKNLS